MFAMRVILFARSNLSDCLCSLDDIQCAVVTNSMRWSKSKSSDEWNRTVHNHLHIAYTESNAVKMFVAMKTIKTNAFGTHK